eukprot:1152551-Pelagomonas_calceolata.AAC.1
MAAQEAIDAVMKQQKTPVTMYVSYTVPIRVCPSVFRDARTHLQRDHPLDQHCPTLLSGYLGTGKTTVLRHLLENSKDKIACVVNDVASVNIDAKLVRNDRARGSDAKSSTKVGFTLKGGTPSRTYMYP